MKILLARFLTLSLWEKIGMIFFSSLLLYLTETWKTHLILATLVFIRHIVCAFLVIIKYGSIGYNDLNGYTTGFI